MNYIKKFEAGTWWKPPFNGLPGFGDKKEEGKPYKPWGVKSEPKVEQTPAPAKKIIKEIKISIAEVSFEALCKTGVIKGLPGGVEIPVSQSEFDRLVDGEHVIFYRPSITGDKAYNINILDDVPYSSLFDSIGRSKIYKF